MKIITPTYYTAGVTKENYTQFMDTTVAIM